MTSRQFQSPTLFTQHRFTTHHQHLKRTTFLWEEESQILYLLLFKLTLSWFKSINDFNFVILSILFSSNVIFMSDQELLECSSVPWPFHRHQCFSPPWMKALLSCFCENSFNCASLFCVYSTIQKVIRPNNIAVFNILIHLPILVYLFRQPLRIFLKNSTMQLSQLMLIL